MRDVANDKATLRSHLVHTRSLIGVAGRAQTAEGIGRELAALPELGGALTVAAYVPVGSEPGPRDLPGVLAGLGHRVLLPVLLDDNDLDWAAYDGPDSLVKAGRGLREPAGPRLGAGAVREADVLIVPGLAVDRTGMRLGRGGGSYDRALARTTAFTLVLLHEDEILDRPVPAEAHDRPVDAAVTAAGVLRF